MKTKSTKRALLLSALSLLLCVSMLIGSTYAWFTDSVTSGSNIIKAGRLDIVLEYWDGTQWADAEGKMLEFVKADTTAGTEVLWEPGCTYQLPKIRVRNVGNLAAKVLIKLNGIKGDEKLLEAIDLTTTITNIPESILNGSQASVLAPYNNATINPIYNTPDNTVIFDWSLMGAGVVSPNSGHTDTSPEFTIAGHMKEEAGNEYQGLMIEGVSITVLATQEVFEYDSFGREYDRASEFLNKDENGNLLITSAGDLLYLSQQVDAGNSFKGKTILLANDVDLKNVTWEPIGSKSKGFEGTFDGQNHTVSNFKVEKTEYAGLFGYMLNGGNVKNLTVKGATIKATDRAGAVLGAGYTDIVNCHAVDCEITVIPALQDNGEFDGGAKAGGVAGQLFEGAGMSIVGCTATNVKVTGYRDIGAVLGMAHNNNTVTDCKAYDSEVAYYYLEDGQKYDSNTPNENIGEVVGRRNSGVVESGTYFENVTLKVRKTGISDFASLKQALANGEKEIYISGVITLTEGLAASDVTFIGAGAGAGINFNGHNIGGSNTITYKDLALTTVALGDDAGERAAFHGGIDYNGHAVANYVNCSLTGVFTTYSDTVNATDCTFNYYVQDGEEYYGLFLYASGVVNATNCTFMYGDRAIKIYSEGPADYELNINGGQIVATEDYKLNKALINVDSTYLNSAKITVNGLTIDAKLATVPLHNASGNSKVTVAWN